MSKLAVRVREHTIEALGEPGLGPLRAELAGAGGGAREQVTVDFLEDDLRAAEDTLDRLRAYVEELGGVLRSGRAGRGEILALAREDQPLRGLDDLQATITGIRRRLAVLALRLPR
jgi:hypothetical protein